jgi:hypothetical protein
MLCSLLKKEVMGVKEDDYDGMTEVSCAHVKKILNH